MPEQERYVPGSTLPETYYEHVHRYTLAQSLAEGKDVIDLGCGEGYGAHRLGLVARSVRAVDTASEAVKTARARYAAPNLEFVVADATCTGLPATSGDLVVAFELYEHLENAAALLAEARRLLRPGGLLLVSTPNRAVYSGSRGYRNPFHKHEVDVEGFRTELRAHFNHVRLHLQRVVRLSAIWSDGSANGRENEGSARLADVPPLYLIAFCSDAPLPSVASCSLWLDPHEILDVESSEIVIARETIEGKDRELDIARTTIAQKDQELRTAAATIATKDEQLSAASSAMDALQNRVDAAGERDDHQAATLLRLREDLDDLRANLVAASAAQEELKAQLAESRVLLAESRVLVQAHEVERAHLTELVKAKEAEVVRAHDTIGKLAKDAENSRNALEQLSQLRHKIDGLENMLPVGGRLPRLRVIGSIEEPQGPMPQSGDIGVVGWVISLGRPINRISVRAGRRVLAVAERGLARPDVHAAHPLPGAASSGFRASFDVGLVPKIARRIRIVAEAGRQSTTIGVLAGSVNQMSPTRALRSGLKTARAAYRYARTGRISINPATWPRLVRLGLGYWFAGAVSVDGTTPDQGYDPFEEWVAGHRLAAPKLRALAAERLHFTTTPLISVVVAVHNVSEQWLRKCLDSVVNQTYEKWELCVADDCSTQPHVRRVLHEYEARLGPSRFKLTLLDTPHHISRAINAAAEPAGGEYVAFLDHDDELTQDALQAVVRAAHEQRADLYYSDDDKIDAHGRRYAPQFKPDWSPELLLSYAYVGHLVVMRTAFFRSLGGFRQGFEGSQDYDLLLRAAEAAPCVVHIPHILYHWRALPESTASSAAAKSYSIDNGRRAVAEALVRRGMHGTVAQPPFATQAGIGIFKVDYAGIDESKVSIIVPTHNGQYLKQCIDSLERTVYSNFEVIIADNLSDDPRVTEYLRTVKHRVIRVGHPASGSFNFSFVVNQASRAADGKYLLLLNDDTEVLSAEWLRAMVGVLQDSEVGAVGAKLLYPDNRIQHAGVLLGGGAKGLARHAFRLAAGEAGGYLSYAQVMRNYSAVTAACMLTRRDLFERLGGFDEQQFGVAYNDVDYCLRLREHGFRIVYQPEAVLMHREGVSRGTHDNPREEAAFEEAWVANRVDPYDNENLRLDSDQFEIDAGKIDSPVCVRPLHVTMIGHNLNVEGAPLFQYNIVKGLSGQGWACDVVVPQDGPLRARYGAHGVVPQVIRHPMAGASSTASLREALRRLGEQWRNDGVDVVHANTLHGFWGVVAAHSAGLPSIWSIHESVDPRDYFRQLPAQAYELAVGALDEADRIVFVADATREMFRPKVGRPFRLLTIPNGLDLDTIDRYCAETSKAQARSELAVDDGRFVWLIVGTTTPRKGQLHFVQAANKVLDMPGGPECEFWIVGARESPYLSELREAVALSRDPSRFRIVTETPAVYPYYRAADGFVCASLEESLPAVVLEAFAFGLKLVSTNVFGIPEMVRDEVDGLLVPPANAAALASSMLRVLREPEGARDRAASARQRLLQKFCLPRMVEAYRDLFLGIVESGDICAPAEH